MGKFNATTAVEQLDWDFTKYGDGREGTIPEPTTQQIQDYFTAIRNIAKSVQQLKVDAEKMQAGGEEMTDEKVAEIMASLEDLDIATFQDSMKDSIAALCSDQPAREDLDALPFRVLQAFMQWVTGEFRPEAGAATSNR